MMTKPPRIPPNAIISWNVLEEVAGKMLTLGVFKSLRLVFSVVEDVGSTMREKKNKEIY